MQRQHETEQTSVTLRICYSAAIAALLMVGQVSLRVVPNVEVVTLIIIVSAYVFPPSVTLAAVLAFCTGQWLVYPSGYWVVAYYLYWPLLALAATSLKLVKKLHLRVVIAAAIAVLATAFFGVLTSATEVAMAIGFQKDFLLYFCVVYARGISFYAVHVASNLAIVSILFAPLSLALKRISKKTLV